MEKDIIKYLEDEHDVSHSPDKSIAQDCPSCPELVKKVIELIEALERLTK
jgi:hypothetical protein